MAHSLVIRCMLAIVLAFWSPALCCCAFGMSESHGAAEPIEPIEAPAPTQRHNCCSRQAEPADDAPERTDLQFESSADQHSERCECSSHMKPDATADFQRIALPSLLEIGVHFDALLPMAPTFIAAADLRQDRWTALQQHAPPLRADTLLARGCLLTT